MGVKGAEDLAFPRYDVFLSFRGPDVRKSFADHLYKALVDQGFRTFRDYEEIRVGENINSEIANAIRGSTVSIIILTNDYASSRPCLTELSLIMRRKRAEGHRVMPVFYGVKVAQVKFQTGQYAKAFAKHKKRLRGDPKVEMWRKDLSDIAELLGKTPDNRYETVFIQDIVNEVRNMLARDKQLLPVSRPRVGQKYLADQIVARLQKFKNVIDIPTLSKAGRLGLKALCKTVFHSNSYSIGGSSSLAQILEDFGGVNHIVYLLDCASNLMKKNDSDSQNMHDDSVSMKALIAVKQPGLVLPLGIVGRANLLSQIHKWVQRVTKHVGVSILFGKEGVGKTTTARIIYDSNYAKFDGCGFLANIGESSKANGFISLLRKLLYDLTKARNIDISDVDEGIRKIKEATRSKRVLIVVDDVPDLHHFSAILGMRECLFPDSKIIMTTRDASLLKAHGMFKKFEVMELDFDDSFQLLNWHAFRQYHPVEEYMQYSEKIVQHCGGLPTALKVIGSSLAKLSPAEWKKVLEQLKEVTDTRAHKVLITVYNRLLDADKSLFLDISCFFIGKDKDEVVSNLEGRGFSAQIGIQSLIDRCLIFIDEDNRIRMDELLVNMGREIVRQEAPESPGQRSRILYAAEALYILRHQTGTESIEGLSLDMRSPEGIRFTKEREVYHRNQHEAEDPFGSGRQRSDLSLWDHLKCLCLWDAFEATWGLTFPESNDVMELQTDAFKDMQSLRLLRLNHVELSGSYRKFPKHLQWLCWHGFAFDSLPKELCLSNLVSLELCNSKVKHNWKNGKVLPLLKSLDLSSCDGLKRTPDLKGLPSLEKLMIKDCINLIEVDDSIGHLKKLIFLDLSGCRSLRKVSKTLATLGSVKKLDVSGCPMLQDFLQSCPRMYSFRILCSDRKFS